MKRNRQILIKVTNEEKKIIKKNAEKEGLQVSPFVRQRCMMDNPLEFIKKGLKMEYGDEDHRKSKISSISKTKRRF